MASHEPHHRLLTVTVVAALVLVGCAGDDDLDHQQAQVAARGAEVMPFDLDATTHVFTNTDDGGIQVVAADDPRDQTQIDLIRQHLQQERDNFARGDYDDPARIHGMDMPGVAELSEGYADIEVSYVERPDGAALVYTTADSDLVAAVHAWFDRQVMDHGDHAEVG